MSLRMSQDKQSVYLNFKKKMVEFCKRWSVCELALFGSALRGDFNPKSDLDVLCNFCS
jgi:predicted nucleotidyltransferase